MNGSTTRSRSTRAFAVALPLALTLCGGAVRGAPLVAPANGQAPAAGTPPITVPPAAEQIAAAVLAAPADRRAGAQVLGYVLAGGSLALDTLRAGTNDLICLADKPGDERWSVACYHQSLEPYMRRGRELEAAGVPGEERQKRRWSEADAGTLPMPKTPATLYVLSGKGYDAARGEAIDAHLRYVVYTPWATQESTGLPLSPPGPGGPWIMFPGTAGAHIMITPPKESAPPAVPANPVPPATPATPAGKDPRRR